METLLLIGGPYDGETRTILHGAPTIQLVEPLPLPDIEDLRGKRRKVYEMEDFKTVLYRRKTFVAEAGLGGIEKISVMAIGETTTAQTILRLIQHYHPPKREEEG